MLILNLIIYYYLAKSMGHIYYHWCGESKNRGDSFVVNIDQIIDILKNCILKT